MGAYFLLHGFSYLPCSLLGRTSPSRTVWSLLLWSLMLQVFFHKMLTECRNLSSITARITDSNVFYQSTQFEVRKCFKAYLEHAMTSKANYDDAFFSCTEKDFFVTLECNRSFLIKSVFTFTCILIWLCFSLKYLVFIQSVLMAQM